ncbi:MAG: tRNA (guanosine(37)-N1)-methyltransferase TrmD [Desulfobacteraceae bacterium]|nr:tRNA (guanosine(37)-N1)-methyltransferase TrmD [Desulfobacteraceae bacterium]
MNIAVLTIFPDLFEPFWSYGIVRRAIDKNRIAQQTINIRDFAPGRHRVTDDRPYGGGCGMVMKPEPLAGAIRAAKEKSPTSKAILLTPQGKVFNQQMARDLAACDGMVMVCGRYEGIDERICHRYIDDEVSIGDFVMTGGELAAMVIIDAVIRLLPDVLGNEDSADNDSFSNGLLEHAHFTRPPEFEGMDVPDVLMSGNHGRIDRWRLESALMRTFLKRPDLLMSKQLSAEEIDILKSWYQQIERIIQAKSLPGSGALPGKG